jgi:hypothetical protein
MKIKNNQNINLEKLKEILENELPDFKYKINNNAVTVIKNDDTKINIVQVGKEYWAVEAVPFQFKLIIVLVLITMFAYWVQLQGWYWAVNVGLYVAAFIVLGYVSNWLFAMIYFKKFKDFKFKLLKTLENALK